MRYFVTRFLQQADEFVSQLDQKSANKLFYNIDLVEHKNDQKINVIVNELQSLKKKRESGPLSKNDSLRIEYLFNQYQKLKNGL